MAKFKIKKGQRKEGQKGMNGYMELNSSKNRKSVFCGDWKIYENNPAH